jgi:uroporphyrin-III C-methyltransferase
VSDANPPSISAAASPEPAATAAAAQAAAPNHHARWFAAGAVLLTALATAALVFAWNTQQRVKALEGELVKRQQDSGSQATEARLAARQAQELARESAAKLSLLEARVAEATLQRSQLEDLIQSLSRSRDENVLADVDAAVRVALQQAAITGSAEPMLATLRQSDERLARYNQPRLERVRRAIAQDLDRVRAGVTDITVLTIRLDEVIRLVDELPLLANDRKPDPRVAPRAAAAASATHWGSAASDRWSAWSDKLWQEVRGLVRVTRIDNPEAMLVAPEQAFFLRENLKLRLLNARLALLSRQFDTAQTDLRDAQATLERYFERGHKRVSVALEGVKQVSAQARMVSVPRPDATLAAIATATAGR